MRAMCKFFRARWTTRAAVLKKVEPRPAPKNKIQDGVGWRNLIPSAIHVPSGTRLGLAWGEHVLTNSSYACFKPLLYFPRDFPEQIHTFTLPSVILSPGDTPPPPPPQTRRLGKRIVETDQPSTTIKNDFDFGAKLRFINHFHMYR